jgi:uncharacterized membrane protein
MTSRKIKLYLIFLLTSFILVNPINLQSVKSRELTTNYDFPKQSKTVSTLIPNAIENETLLAHHMGIKVNNDYSLKVTSTYVVTNNDTQQLDYFAVLIGKNISSVFSYDPIGTLSFTWLINTTIGSLINVSMRYPLFPNETYVFSIEYRIDNVIYSVQEPIEYFGLDFEVTHPRKTDLFELELCLPSESDLLDQSPPEPVYPAPQRIVDEDGIVKIYWELENRDMDDNDVFLVRFVSTTTDIPSGSNLKPLFYILTLLAGILLGSLILFLVYNFKVKPSESQLVSSLLTKTEQEVIRAINQDGGVSTQRRICEKTGYSKSKVSQILLKLEQRNVLIRERWGRTNKVTITAPSFKTIGITEEKTE